MPTNPAQMVAERFRFQWRWPAVDAFHPADRRIRVGLNRYPGCVIGAYVVLFGRGVGLRWGRPGEVIRDA